MKILPNSLIFLAEVGTVGSVMLIKFEVIVKVPFQF